MRINPKDYRLDILDRAIILTGLEKHLKDVEARAAKLRTSTRPNSLASLERVEMTAARIADLIATFEKD